MEELLAQTTFDKLKEGSIIKGTITEIRQTEVVVDIGGKSEGMISASEFADLGDLQIGEEIEIYLEKTRGSRRKPSPVFRQGRAKEELGKYNHQV